MNTIRSVGYGWGILIAAGGGAYYFAKKGIDADRLERGQKHREKLAQQASIREQEYLIDRPSDRRVAPGAGSNSSGDPSREAAEPAPTRHAPETEGQRVGEKSKFEATEVWRSRKGDRFS